MWQNDIIFFKVVLKNLLVKIYGFDGGIFYPMQKIIMHHQLFLMM